MVSSCRGEMCSTIRPMCCVKLLLHPPTPMISRCRQAIPDSSTYRSHSCWFSNTWVINVKNTWLKLVLVLCFSSYQTFSPFFTFKQCNLISTPPPQLCQITVVARRREKPSLIEALPRVVATSPPCLKQTLVIESIVWQRQLPFKSRVSFWPSARASEACRSFSLTSSAKCRASRCQSCMQCC